MNDGVSLRSASHPRLSWWRRLVGLVLPRQPDIDPASLVRVVIQIPDPPEPPTLVGKLRAIGSLQQGDPLPHWMYDEINSWASKFSSMCNDAADEIGLAEQETSALREVLLYVLEDEPNGVPRASSSCRDHIRKVLGC